MTRWDDLWAKPSTMIMTGVEVRGSDWLEQIEVEGYKMQEKLEAVRSVLTEISEGKGAYNRDYLTHAENCIRDMKALAVKGLEILS